MKQYTVMIHSRRNDRQVTGTIPELIEYFSYTLLKGHSWENEPGNKKINMAPKTAASLITNLNRAEDNAACNGCGSTWYSLA